MHDFLVEIHTEELPPNTLKRLATHFLDEIKIRLNKLELSHGNAQYFVTPRRLAIFIQDLAEHQPDSVIERKGPALAAAFDKQGEPTPACLGFARSCGVSPEQLEKTITPQGEWMSYKQSVSGKSVTSVLPDVIEQALGALPIPKRMRWGDNTIEFTRPIHSVVLLYGNDMVTANIFGLPAGRKTRAHRFLSPDWIDIPRPSQYADVLKKHFVLADFDERKEKIRILAQEAVKQLSQQIAQSVHANIDESLLEEITGLVEWPVALCGHFDPEFLMVPQEALVSAMQDHQRYFPIVDSQGKLQPYFVIISNLESKNPKQVIAGNERVLRARLSDAKFFFDTDIKYFHGIDIEHLKHIIYINKLGTLWDKSVRLSQLSEIIAKKISGETDISVESAQAGLLAKFDLTSQLVGEFPELQGIAGSYYINGGHLEKTTPISQAVREHYLPRFSGDVLPSSLTACSVALADRLDALVGLFGIQQIPTGEKDPFGLRRAALGILRIMIEKKCDADLRELIEESISIYQTQSLLLEKNEELTDRILNFIFERLKPWYQEQHISPDVYTAVTALNVTRPYNFHCRIQAVQAFKQLPEAEALSSANKRVSNILSKYNGTLSVHEIQPELLEEDAERQLASALQKERDAIAHLAHLEKYAEVLTRLASLREPVDYFFDKVLVMTEDKPRRENRLLLLKQLRELFLQVADIALLQP